MDSYEEWFANRMPEQSGSSTEYILLVLLLRTATYNDTGDTPKFCRHRLGRDGKQ